MTVRQKIEQLNQLYANIIQEMPSIVEEMAVTGVSLVKNRSINDGINQDGKEGSKATYSTNKTRTFKFLPKARNEAGRKYVKANRLGTWFEFRKAQGLTNEQVNLSYTNEMWRNYGLIQYRQSGTKFVYEVGTKGDANKFEENVKRYGKFYLNEPNEVQRLQNDVRKRLSEVFKNALRK